MINVLVQMFKGLFSPSIHPFGGASSRTYAWNPGTGRYLDIIGAAILAVGMLLLFIMRRDHDIPTTLLVPSPMETEDKPAPPKPPDLSPTP
jgi:hypothetical protein